MGTAVQHDRDLSDGRATSAPSAGELAASESVSSEAQHRDRPTEGWSRSFFTPLLALIALSPFGAGAYLIVRGGSLSGRLFGDRAVIALTAADVWRTPVLLGPYSRFYWHHPGPVYFYILGVWNSVFGGRTLGLTLGATAINLAASAGILVIAHRRGGRPLVAWTSLFVAFYLAAIGPVAFDVWSPSVTLLPFALALLLAWSVACRDWWAGPWLVFVGTFAVQTHIALVPGVVTACGVAAVVGTWRHRRRNPCEQEREARVIRRSLLVSATTGFLLWLPPLIQQFTSVDGNLSALAQFFLRSGREHDLSSGLTHTALQLTLIVRAVFEPVTLRSDAHQGLVLAMVATFIALAVALCAAIKNHAADVLVLLLLVVTELFAGVYSVTRISGPIEFYLVQWISAVGLVFWIALGNALITFVRRRTSVRPWPRVVTVAGACLLAALVCAGAVRSYSQVTQANGGPVHRADQDLFDREAVNRMLSMTQRDRRVVLRLDSAPAWVILATDALVLEQHGRDVRILESPVTRLLFDDALLVRTASASRVFVFRDRADRAIATHGARIDDIAPQGRWGIAAIEPGSGS